MAPTLDIVNSEWDLFVGVSTETEPFRRFCEDQCIEKGGNVKHAADPSVARYLFAGSYQGAYNVRFLQRVDVGSQRPVLQPPDGLVLITDESKKFYDRVVSRHPDMHDLHGWGKTPHESLRKLMAGKPRRTHEWRVYTPTPAEAFAWLRRVPHDYSSATVSSKPLELAAEPALSPHGRSFSLTPTVLLFCVQPATAPPATAPPVTPMTVPPTITPLTAHPRWGCNPYIAKPIRQTMMSVAPIRSSAWRYGPKIGSMACAKWLKVVPTPCRPS